MLGWFILLCGIHCLKSGNAVQRRPDSMYLSHASTWPQTGEMEPSRKIQTKQESNMKHLFFTTHGNTYPEMAQQKDNDVCSYLSLSIFRAQRLSILSIFIFVTFWIPGCQISKFLYFQIQGCQQEIAGPRLRDSSAVAPDHKVGEIQGTRAIPWEPHQCTPCMGNQ